MKRAVGVILVSLSALSIGYEYSHAKSKFVGTLKLQPENCQQEKFCILAENFGYLDKREIGWQADKGDKTDGASIPKWAQRFVGVPYTPQYLKAAVLHDHYSKSVRPVRGWFETQRMFYEALLDSVVKKRRALILYAGVLIGSGKWITRIKGKKCAVGEWCFSNAQEITYQREPESFGETQYNNSFQAVKSVIEQEGLSSEEEVVEFIRKMDPGSIYLTHPTGVIDETSTQRSYWE